MRVFIQSDAGGYGGDRDHQVAEGRLSLPLICHQRLPFLQAAESERTTVYATWHRPAASGDFDPPLDYLLDAHQAPMIRIVGVSDQVVSSTMRTWPTLR